MHATTRRHRHRHRHRQIGKYTNANTCTRTQAHNYTHAHSTQHCRLIHVHAEADLVGKLANNGAKGEDANWKDVDDEEHAHHGEGSKAALVRLQLGTNVVCAQLGEGATQQPKACTGGKRASA